MVQAPSVAGLAAVGLLLLALALLVPKFARNRRTIMNVSRSCELSEAAHLVTTKTPGHGGAIVEPAPAQRRPVSLLALANQNPSPKLTNQELTMNQNQGITGQRETSGRAAYLALRAARARRRLNLSLFLLVCTGAAWGYQYVPGMSLAWYYALIPTVLLLLVLVSGRMAAIAAKASDERYLASLGSTVRRNRQFAPALSPVDTLDDEGYLDDEYESFDEDADIPYVNDQLVIPATQLIPEADQRLAVMENLRDDPEFETRWSLGAPEVPAKRGFRNRAAKYEMAC